MGKAIFLTHPLFPLAPPARRHCQQQLCRTVLGL